MPIDSNIPMSFKPVQIQNPLEQYAQVQQIQQAQNHNRLADLMYGEKQRELSAENAFSNLLAGGKAGQDIVQGLASQGYGNKAMAYNKMLQEQEKQKADIAKTNAETGKFNVEAAHKKLDIAGQAFGFVRANPTLENAHATLDYLGQQGIYTPEQVATYKAQVSADPSKIAALADQAFRSALTAKDQLAQYQTRNTGGTTDTIQIDPVTGKTVVVNSVRNTISPDAALSSSTQLKTTAMNNAATTRGQDITDKRERELNGQKPLTESQGKATTFAARMGDAEDAIKSLEAGGVTGKNFRTIAAGSNFTNWLASPAGQQYRQAQENWVTANLRQESGAAIGKDEMEKDVRKFFPVPGDSDAVIVQKARSREVARQGMLTQAGPGAAKVPGIIKSASNTSVPDDIAELLKKHGGK